MKITSPDPRANGESSYGSTTLEFHNGVAEIEDLPTGLEAYLLSAGYGLYDQDAEDAKVQAKAEADAAEQAKAAAKGGKQA